MRKEAHLPPPAPTPTCTKVPLAITQGVSAACQDQRHTGGRNQSPGNDREAQGVLKYRKINARLGHWKDSSRERLLIYNEGDRQGTSLKL